MNAKKVWGLALCLLGSGTAGALAAEAGAGGAGAVVHLSGTLSVQRADGGIKVLGPKSEVQPGDVLSTQRDSYAQINFTDGSSLTLRPNSQMKIDGYNYVSDKPEADSAFFRLIKGGLRTVTGLVGKRGNQDAYRIGTATATIGIRGSIGNALHCEGGSSCGGVVPGGDKLPPGTHLQSDTGNFVMQVGAQTVLIKEGTTGYSNGAAVTVTIGAIGGGSVNLNIPIGGAPVPAGCK